MLLHRYRAQCIPAGVLWYDARIHYFVIKYGLEEAILNGWRKSLKFIAATLNLLIVLAVFISLFSPTGMIASWRAADVREEKHVYQTLNDDPATHQCEDGGGPATQAVAYGYDPPIIRWYCDPTKAPPSIMVPSSAVPIPANAPINFALYIVVILIHAYVLWFSLSAFAHVSPVIASPQLLRAIQHRLSAKFATEYSANSKKDPFGLIVGYIVVIGNLTYRLLHFH